MYFEYFFDEAIRSLEPPDPSCYNWRAGETVWLIIKLLQQIEKRTMTIMWARHMKPELLLPAQRLSLSGKGW